MGRAPCCDKANVKKGPWSPEEDATLKSYIHKHGTGGNWIALPTKIGLKRCGKSCRLRWLNYLRPNIKHGGFTQEEDNLICSFYVNIGSRWSIIAAQLPGRTDNDIKNYWNTRLKKKLFGKQRCRSEKRSDRSKERLPPPPFLVGDQPTENSLTKTPPLMPETELCYDTHAQVMSPLKGGYQQMCGNSRFETDFSMLDGMYGSMAQPLSWVDATSWRDISYVSYTSVGAYHQEMPQYYCGLFDEPRLLPYSQ